MSKYSSYILYLLISIFVVIIFINGFGPLDSLQQSINDMLCRINAEKSTRPNIALVTIDGRAEDEYGYWPWNRDLIADLLAATASGEPKVIVLNAILPEDPRQDSAGYTKILAGQLSWISDVVLPYDVALTNFRSNKMNNPEYLFNYSVMIDNPLSQLDEESSLLARKVFLPAQKLVEQNPLLGFKYNQPDDDRILRHQPLILNYEGYYYPSLSLLAAAAYFDVEPEQIKVVEKQEIQLGGLRSIPINDKSEIFINFSNREAFPIFSAAEILGQGFNYDLLKGKIILIGNDVINSDEIYDTPVLKNAPEILIKATVIENIVNNNLLVEKKDMALLSMLILFAMGAVCAFLLPRINLMYRMVVLFVGLVILGNINYFLFTSFHVIVNMLYFALELVFFMIASPFLDSTILSGNPRAQAVATEVPKLKKKTKEPNSADIPVRELTESEQAPENQATLATSAPDHDVSGLKDYQTINLDGDQRDRSESEKTKASSQEHAISDRGSDFEPDRITLSDDEPPREAMKPVAMQDSQTSLTESDRLLTNSDDIKNLGRYQVTGIQGKGAMGMVYRGLDPAINRPVALKTIRLDFVNDPEELSELKERLHREAQAAGKMSHPNIVTIYDVGSEGHLQYIAMELLEGQTLEDIIKKKVKFNYRIFAQIIIQICQALDYAHNQGIVHRDIKPANIMVLSDYRIKVMDFGIARIDSNSMTKTGIAMGTPNYISPEQLKGLQVDKRADIFSLGVVMYEMLIGRRPFKGENITSLIYAIINKEPEKPSNINPQIPLLFDHIIERALKKNPQERYQSALELAAALKDFVESFAAR
ncbi:MAG: protein kinase domain-containing protein [Candidatus Zixiibacteriota bacterium]